MTPLERRALIRGICIGALLPFPLGVALGHVIGRVHAVWISWPPPRWPLRCAGFDLRR